MLHLRMVARGAKQGMQELWAEQRRKRKKWAVFIYSWVSALSIA